MARESYEAYWRRESRSLTRSTMEILLQAQDPNTYYGRTVLRIVKEEAARRGWVVRKNGHSYKVQGK